MKGTHNTVGIFGESGLDREVRNWQRKQFKIKLRMELERIRAFKGAAEKSNVIVV